MTRYRYCNHLINQIKSEWHDTPAKTDAKVQTGLVKSKERFVSSKLYLPKNYEYSHPFKNNKLSTNHQLYFDAKHFLQ